MKKLLLLCALVGLLIAVLPKPALAQSCDIDCVRMLDPRTHEFEEYGCSDGDHETCEPDGNFCAALQCAAPMAVLDETSRATMTLEFCPLVNDGQATLTDILVADSDPPAVDPVEGTPKKD